MAGLDGAGGVIGWHLGIARDMPPGQAERLEYVHKCGCGMCCRISMRCDSSPMDDVSYACKCGAPRVEFEVYRPISPPGAHWSIQIKDGPKVPAASVNHIMERSKFPLFDHRAYDIMSGVPLTRDCLDKALEEITRLRGINSVLQDGRDEWSEHAAQIELERDKAIFERDVLRAEREGLIALVQQHAECIANLTREVKRLSGRARPICVDNGWDVDD